MSKYDKEDQVTLIVTDGSDTAPIVKPALDKLNIYILYDLAHKLFEPSGHEIVMGVTRETSVIKDKNKVKKILSNPSIKMNQYGEITSFSKSFIKQMVYDDIITYKVVHDYRLHFELLTIYYIKCEILKDIESEILAIKDTL